MRVQEALRHLTVRLADGQIDGPAREARLLLAHAMNVPHDRLVLMGHDELAPDVYDRAQAFCLRRTQGEPTSNIRGYREFYGRQFTVNHHVLDPRPETECLIVEALTAPFSTVLDLGTGSGCILLTLLAERSGISGTGGDLSPEALSVAKINAKALGVSDRATFVQSDWFDAIKGPFDLIVSNPPYITDAEMAELSPEVLNFDPHMALTPGGDGLDPYRILAQQAQGYLTPRGRILCEFGWKQGADVTALFQDAGWSDVRILPDLDGRDRVLAATRR
ncbi:MAG: peptide chain release factor N(5)-glutamine methyltransferase [Thalassovita sp.]